MKIILVFSVIFVLSSFYRLKGATNTLVSGTNWATATWSLGHIPNNTENVVIPSGTINITTAAVCASLKIGTGTTNTTVALGAGGSLLIDNSAGGTGNLTFGGTSNWGFYTLNAATQSVTITGSVVYGVKGFCYVTISTGTVTINGLLTLSTKDFLQFTSTGKVYLNGGLTDGVGTLATASGCNVYIKTSYTITANTTWGAGSNAILNSSLTINTGGNSLTFGNLNVANGTATLAGGGFTVNGNLSIAAGATLNCGANSITGSSTGLFTMGANSNLILGSTTSTTSVSFPTNYVAANISLNVTSTVSYNSNANQTISNVPTYGNLSVTTGNTASTKTFAANTTITGNLTATNGTATVTLSASTSTINLSGNYMGNGNLTFTSGTFNIGGNWTNTGTFTAGTGTVNYNGTGTQTIGAVNYYNLTSSNTGARVLASSGTIGIANIFTPGTNTYTVTGSTINYNGGVNQNVVGFNYNNLTLSNTGTKTATGNINLYGICTLSGSVIFDADGASNDKIFTLKSSSSATASIAAIPVTALFSGNIVAERFAPGGTTGWAILGSPTSGGTLAKWLDDFPMSGFPGSTGDAGGFISVYTYDETINDISDNRYVPANNITNPINVGKGYFVYLGDGYTSTNDIIIDTDGPITQGNFSFNPSYTSTTYGVTEDGWNLVANPYPSAIDWDAAGWTKTNISSTIYLYNADIGNYATYTTGVGGTNGGSRYIAMAQGFFIKATSASPALTISESCKAPNQNPTFFRQADYSVTAIQPESFSLQLLGSGNYRDETVLYFSPTGSPQFVLEEDALKLFSTENGAVNISSVVENKDLVLNNLGNGLNSTIEVPIRVTTTNSQNVTLRVAYSNNFPLGTCLTLLDLATNQQYPLTSNFSLSFYLSDTTQAPRFKLLIEKTLSANVYTADCYSNFSGVVLQSPQSLTVNVFNQQNNTSNSYLLSSNVDSIQLVPGSYVFTYSLGNCGSRSDTITILDERVNVVADFSLGLDTLDLAQTNQWVPINLSQNATDYLWQVADMSSTDYSPVFIIPAEGVYPVQLIASYGVCTDTLSKFLVVTNNAVTGINKSNQTKPFKLYQTNEQQVAIENNTGDSFVVEMYDSKGSLVKKILFGNEKLHTMNLKTFNSGYYLIYIKSDKNNSVFKIIK